MANYCKRCGALLEEGARFCPSCGAKLDSPQKTFCPSCGAELAPGAKFCKRCGARVAEEGPAPIVIDAPPGSTVVISDGPPVPVGAAPTGQSAPQPKRAAKTRAKAAAKPKKKGRGLSLFLALVMLVELGVAGFKYPGFLRKGGGGGAGEVPASPVLRPPRFPRAASALSRGACRMRRTTKRTAPSRKPSACAIRRSRSPRPPRRRRRSIGRLPTSGSGRWRCIWTLGTWRKKRTPSS